MFLRITAALLAASLHGVAAQPPSHGLAAQPPSHGIAAQRPSLGVAGQRAWLGVAAPQPSPRVAAPQAALNLAVSHAALDMLTPSQEAADVALMRGAYERVHPGLYRYVDAQTIAAAFDRLATFAKSPHPTLAFYGAISEMIAQIHCDHSKAEYPADIERYRETQPTFFPFRLRIVAGRMYISSSDPRQSGLTTGSEILAIDGHRTSEIVAAISRAISYDGFTSFVIPSKLEADADLMGSDFEQFCPVYYGFSDTRIIEIRERGSVAVRTITVHPILYRDWIALPWPALADRSQLFNGTTWRQLHAGTAYLRVDSFVNYRRPVDAMAFYDAFFKPINASGATRLIVDLRWNGGGSTDATIALARFLLTERFDWNAPMRVKTLDYGNLPRYAQTWGDQNALFHPNPRAYRRLPDGFYEIIPGALHTDEDGEMLPIDVSPDRFRGQVVVLTGPRNASGSTMLIAKLHDAKRALLVGEPTGGSAEGPTAGFILFLKLPNSGITVRVPDMWNRMAVSRFTPGYGVSPDVVVVPTLDDVLDAHDPVLEAASALAPAPP